MVAIVSDGSAVLGLGNIGPEAAMPVMEGKAMLFKEFADVDAFPICLDTQDTDEIVKAVELISPTFGGINLEDISAPRCFEIEERLKESIDIPVFHDDQHGTAVVVMAALFNALKIVGKPIEELRVLVVGLGAAGVAVSKMMLASGVTHIVGCDRRGALSTTREDYESGEMSPIKRWYAESSNPDKVTGPPADVIEGMDMFVGLSGPGIIPPEALGKMNDDAIVFAMANPNPEVMPEDAAPYVRIMATGRSDYPNQINNVLCFPGIFRGALDAGAPRITEEMKLAVRRRRRLPDLPRHPGRRRDRQGGGADRPHLRRHQPRGHLRPALLRDRGAAEGVARHPRLPRRPARHRGGDDGGAVQRAEDRRQADRGAAGAGGRARRRRGGGDQDDARLRRHPHRRLRPARRPLHHPRGLPVRRDEPDQALVRGELQPRPA